MRGRLERADRLGVVGWACGEAGKLAVDVLVDGVAIATVPADRYRADLAAAGLGDGACAFEAWLALSPATHQIRVCVNGADLPGSPAFLPAEAASPAGDRLPDEGAPLALVVDEAAPDAARDAGSVALLSHMAALRRLGLRVVFTTLAEAESAITQTAGFVRVAYLHRLRPMALLMGKLRAANPGVRIVFAVADLAHLRAEREAAVCGGAAPSGLRAAELAAARAADAVVTHSAVEAELLARVANVRAYVVPWAMPARPVPIAFADRAGIAFLGSYGHAPNRDAAFVLLDAIMPLVWRTAAIPVVLAGSGMPDDLRQRAGGLVRIMDTLPDTAALWGSVRVSAAPLRFGAGLKGKVLDSLAAGVPCVCSPIAAEGLQLPASLCASDPNEMAAALLFLHEDAAANRREAAAGLAMIAAGHDEAAVDAALAKAITA